MGDTISQHVDNKDRSVSPLFGDAGTATALEKGGGGLACVLGTDGSGAGDLIVKGGRARHRGDAEPDTLFMNGPGVFNFTMERVPPMIDSVLSLAGWDKAEVDLALFHQANKMLVEQLARKAGLPQAKVPIGLGEFGNTSGASVPLMCTSHLRPVLSTGPMRAIIAGFGVGLSFGAVTTTLDGLVMPPLRVLEA